MHQVWVHDGMSSLGDDYQLCLRTDVTADIPLEGYLGVTAATGGLSDDHDVLSFLTHRLVPLEEHAEQVPGHPLLCMCVCDKVYVFVCRC